MRALIFQLARRDFTIRYMGSYLGIVWGYLQPFVSMLLLWFIFEIGFKSQPVQDFPFSLWLFSGMIPWLFFAESIQSGTGSIAEQSWLVKKVVFPVGILPVVRIVSSMFVHIFFVLMLLLAFALYGMEFKWTMLQVIYYSGALFIFVWGLSLITATLVIFVKDVGQIVMLFVQIGFWATPIFWSLKILPEQYRFFFHFNPMYYITDGYRQALIHGEWFWQHPRMTAYFWIVTAVIWIIGVLLFRRLRPHFADVL
jgi:lipopolysaccharide transport system permease protein/teichoic acid transport system permease protein